MKTSAFVPDLRREFSNDPGVELMLGDLDPGMERLSGVAGKDWDAALAEDLARVDTGIDKMDGAACLRHPGLQRLTPCLESRNAGRSEG